MTGFEAALARRLDPDSRAPLIVACSGGGDSTALLHLLLGRTTRPLLAVTVDHGLNPDSARWTAEAGERARALGVAWRALRWEGEKPTTGLQAKARAVRHALLARAAREAGARVVLMAHTADDVAESAMMRAGDAPGLGHLREWSPSPAWPEGRGVFLLRPLLEVRREALRAWLRDHAIAWFDDPANEDQRYARVRARSAIAGRTGLFFSSPVFGGGGPAKLVEGASDICSPSGSSLRSSPPPPDEGEETTGGAPRVHWSGEGATAERSMLTPTTLPPLLLSISGRSAPPRSAEVARMLGVIERGGVATLSGCRVDARRDPVRIVRAPPRKGEAPLPPEPTGWRRYRFEAATGLYPDEASIPLLSA